MEEEYRGSSCLRGLVTLTAFVVLGVAGLMAWQLGLGELVKQVRQGQQPVQNQFVAPPQPTFVPHAAPASAPVIAPLTSLDPEVGGGGSINPEVGGGAPLNVEAGGMTDDISASQQMFEEMSPAQRQELGAPIPTATHIPIEVLGERAGHESSNADYLPSGSGGRGGPSGCDGMSYSECVEYKRNGASGR